jgi:hypothetical protein
LKLILEFEVERRLGEPQLKISIDDYQTLADGAAKDRYQFDFLVNPGAHVLRIQHYGKQPDDHRYDDHGRVTIDQHVAIRGIIMDDVSLEEELWQGRFFPAYWPHDSGPVSISPNLYLGYNGTWMLDFVAPAVQWLVEQRQRGPNLSNTIFKTNSQVLEQAKAFFADLPDV